MVRVRVRVRDRVRVRVRVKVMMRVRVRGRVRDGARARVIGARGYIRFMAKDRGLINKKVPKPIPKP